ncbi:MAG: S24/S26 family peptidase [Muribaculaceae bacterium]|nr:S24/S26 family peptidase [Muribaculaceae bacterium]
MNKPRAIDNDVLLSEICHHLSQGKKVKLRAKGSSMWPFIHGNEDTLLLTPVSTLSKGDIVLAHIDGKRYVIHRIIGIIGDKITLMGDGNLYETEECSRSDIYGKIESVIRDGKVNDLGSPKARLSAIIWRSLLPLRRLKLKLSNMIKRK